MTATPQKKYQLWHPTRGISFSPSARSPNLAPQDAHASNEAAATANQDHSADFYPNDPEAFSSYSRLEDLPLLYPKLDAPNSERAASGSVKENGNGAACTVPADKGNDKQRTSSETRIPDHPPVPALPFKTVDDLFYAAKKAPAGSTNSFWSYTQYRGTAQDGIEQKVKVHYCRSRHTMEKVCQEYFVGEPVLGFDLEWAPDSFKWQGVRKNVSLIQLASPSRIGLFHLALFTDKELEPISPTFKAIMEDSSVTKAGVAIKGDATRLRNFLGVDSKGLSELSHLYKLVTYSARGQYSEINRRLVPLATQVEQYLHLPLFKGQDVRSSDWTKPLSMDQVVYSASDAYAGLQLYATLEHHRRQLDPCPPTPYHAESNLPIRIANGVDLATDDDDPVADAAEETEIETADAKSKNAPPRKPAKPPPGPKDSRIEIAEDRVACYKAARRTRGGTRASFAQLRAYYLWHDQGLEPATVARLLRDPPLKTATVVGYILHTVQLEKLPVDPERLRAEIAGLLPDGMLRARWPGVAAVVAEAGWC